MSIYRRGDNWYVDFTFKGERVRESIGPSRKDAEKVIAKKKTEIVENKYLDVRKEPAPVKFHDFAKEYLEWGKSNKKASTCNRDHYTMRLLDAEFEGKNIQDITAWMIEKYKSKRKQTCKPASVNRELALLKHVFSMAVKWGRMKENPARDVRGLKGATKRVRFLMPDEVQKLLSCCDGIMKGVLRPMVTLAVHTGMRKGEILSLRWGQIDFEQGIITLHDTKNGERRDIPMDETAKTTLRGLERKGELVFPSRNGTRIDYTQIHLTFREALKKAGITDFKFHDLRHTFASNLIMQEGVELNDVRELLGHKNIAMTMRYAHLSPKHKSRVVNVLDRVMSQIPPQGEKVVGLRP
jgi:integrase